MGVISALQMKTNRCHAQQQRQRSKGKELCQVAAIPAYIPAFSVCKELGCDKQNNFSLSFNNKRALAMHSRLRDTTASHNLRVFFLFLGLS